MNQTATNSAFKRFSGISAAMSATVIFGASWLCMDKVNAQPPEKRQFSYNAKAAPSSSDMSDISAYVSQDKDKLAEARAKFVINAPREIVWQVLTNFPEYPNIFHRLESCKITKQEGDLVWTESDLKPHIFVRKQRQHTVNDLSHKPNVLDWKVVDGNFKTVIGKWELSPVGKGDRCTVTYTLSVDPGPIMPKFLISFALRNLQKEIAASLKEWVETYKVSSRTSLHAQEHNHSG